MRYNFIKTGKIRNAVTAGVSPVLTSLTRTLLGGHSVPLLTTTFRIMQNSQNSTPLSAEQILQDLAKFDSISNLKTRVTKVFMAYRTHYHDLPKSQADSIEVDCIRLIDHLDDTAKYLEERKVSALAGN